MLLILVRAILVVGKAAAGLVGVAVDGIVSRRSATNLSVHVASVPDLSERHAQHQHATSAFLSHAAIVFACAPLSTPIDARAH